MATALERRPDALDNTLDRLRNLQEPHTPYQSVGRVPFGITSIFSDPNEALPYELLIRVKEASEAVFCGRGIGLEQKEAVVQYLYKRKISPNFGHYVNTWHTPTMGNAVGSPKRGMQALVADYLTPDIAKAVADVKERFIAELGEAVLLLREVKGCPGFHRYHEGCNKEAFDAKFGGEWHERYARLNDLLKRKVNSLLTKYPAAVEELGHWMWIVKGMPGQYEAGYQYDGGQSGAEFGRKTFFDDITGEASRQGDERGFATVRQKYMALERSLQAHCWGRLNEAADLLDQGEQVKANAIFDTIFPLMSPEKKDELLRTVWEECGKGRDGGDCNFGENFLRGHHGHLERSSRGGIIRQCVKTDQHFPTAVANSELYKKYGCHFTSKDTATFAVYAPKAKRVELEIIKGKNDEVRVLQTIEMVKQADGSWRAEGVPVKRGETVYRYAITGCDDLRRLKTDPYARKAQLRGGRWPIAESDVDGYKWQDKEWIKTRSERNGASGFNVAELNLNTFGRTETGSSFPDIHQLTEDLVKYCKKQNVTHVELYGLLEHMDEKSLGYHISQPFAATSRYFRSPKDVKRMINRLHSEGIGVIVDVSLNQLIRDSSGLEQFDGSSLYNGDYFNPEFCETDFGAKVVNFASEDAKEFYASHLMFLMQEFHIDGFRVDWAFRNFHETVHQNTVDGDGILFEQALAATVAKHDRGVLVIEENGSRVDFGTTTADEFSGSKTAHGRWPMLYNDQVKPEVELDGEGIPHCVKPGMQCKFSSFYSQAIAEPHQLVGQGNPFIVELFRRIGILPANFERDNLVGSINSHDDRGAIPPDTVIAEKVGGFAHRRRMIAMSYLSSPGSVHQMGFEAGSRSGYNPYIEFNDYNPAITRMTSDIGRVIKENSAFWFRKADHSKPNVIHASQHDGLFATRWEEGDNELIIVHNIGPTQFNDGFTLDGVDTDAEYEVIFNSDNPEYQEPGEYRPFNNNVGKEGRKVKIWMAGTSSLVLRKKR